MNTGLSEDQCRSILMRLHVKVPPDKVSPIFVETEASRKVLDKVFSWTATISRGEAPGFLIIKADRGAGKTAILQYLKEKLSEDVIFVYQEKILVSPEDLFRSFVNNIRKTQLTEAARALSPDPLGLYEIVSDGGHNGTAIALAGLLESDNDCWNWLSSGSATLHKLKCGLRMVRNVNDTDALEALSTLVRVLTRKKPVIFAIDELESALNELRKSEKGKLGRLLVNLINHPRFSRILFLCAATDPVYERCFLTLEADSMGLKRRAEDATSVLGLPTSGEAIQILERILDLYTCAYGIRISIAEMDKIKQGYRKLSTMPSLVVSYALQVGNEKIDRPMPPNTPPPTKGKKFEDAVGILLHYIPGSELHLAQTDAIPEGKQLKETIPGLSEIQQYLDWSFRLDSVNFWVETCTTKKENSVIPTPKALAIFAKTLFNKGSVGLFITHNYTHFSVGRGAGRVISRHPEMKKCVGILNVSDEDYEMLMGIMDVEEKDRKERADYISTKIGLYQMIKDLRGGRHFFWQPTWGPTSRESSKRR
ncbi:MAG: P-loop NTPase fold protein [Candidatus Methanofastidiosia archaeon]